MKKNAIMHWFTNITRRPKLLERETLIKLFAATNTHLQATGDNGRLNVAHRKIGEFFELTPTITVDGFTPEKCTQTYLTCEDTVYIYAIDQHIHNGTVTTVLIVLVDKTTPRVEAPLQKFDPLILHAGDIENYTDPTPIATTYGRYLLNYISLASTVGNHIPYINETVKIGKLEREVGKLVRDEKITTAQGRLYLDHTYFLSSLNELFVTTLTEKAVIPTPLLTKTKKELYQHIDMTDVSDPTPFVEAENKLIAIDKNYMKDDPSMDFLGDVSEKFEVHRKRQYCALGVLETFEKAKGNYDYIPGDLYSGWDIKSFVPIVNETRKGSYERGISTAKGGLTTKQMVRAFINNKITAEDCGTTRTLNVHLTKELAEEFYHANMMIAPGKYVTLTEENAHEYIGKDVRFRSMMYCRQKDGFCYTCAGKKFKDLSFTNIGTSAIDIGSVFLSLSMKAMHGVKLTTRYVNDIDEYTV